MLIIKGFIIIPLEMSIKLKDIEGFYLIPNVFGEIESEDIIKQIEAERGNECKQIHTADEFGWKFIPVSKKSKQDYLGPNPKWLDQIWFEATKAISKFIPKLQYLEDFANGYDHVLINHYEVGDGCKPHTDDLKFWNGWVLGVSFGSGCTMNLITNYGKTVPIYLPARSVYLLTGPARYVHKHGITFDSVDNVYGDIINRSKRISLTFRTINLDYLDMESRLESIKDNL